MLRTSKFIFVLLTLTVSAFADEWYIESVDTGNCGFWTSIALDASNNPHISHLCYSGMDYNLKYAYYDGSSWQLETVDTGAVGAFSSIALDTSGYPHISYLDYQTNHDLKYAYFDGSSWQVESVDTAGYVGSYTSIDLDTSDNPHISYLDYGNYDLKYAYFDGSSWQISSVDTVNIGEDCTSIALDTSNNPHIAYYEDSPNNDLKYAYYDGSSWQIESVDTVGNVGTFASIALDSSDMPHISYYDDTNDGLKYAYYDGSSWQLESIDTTDDVGWFTSIAIDTSDNAHISYYDRTNLHLKYAYYDGSSWQISSVDTAERVGLFTSIALDTSDNPRISYQDGTNSELKYAWHNTPPADFNLLSPADGDTVADAPTLDWEDADDAQQVTYDLWYSEETDFDPHEEVTGLTDSTYTFGEGVLTNGTTYYWKVRAWDGYEETWSGPDDYWSFTVDYELDIRVTSFSAVSTADGVEVSWECSDEVSGFNLYRSTASRSGKTVTFRDKLNAELITGESPYTYRDTTVEENITYNYWLEAVDLGGTAESFGPAECTWNGSLPTTYALHQNRPNPASGTTTFAFDLPESCVVTLELYDLTGRKVETVVDDYYLAGTHDITYSPALPPGMYVYRLTAGEFSAVRKMAVVR